MRETSVPENKIKVYVVTHGCYSDYTIDGVFLEKENAISWCNMMRDEADKDDLFDPRDYNIEEYPISDFEDLPPLKKAGISGTFRDDELVLFGVKHALFRPLKFRKLGKSWPVVFDGDLRLRKGESIGEFEERARKVVIDKYFKWKYEGGDSK